MLMSERGDILSELDDMVSREQSSIMVQFDIMIAQEKRITRKTIMDQFIEMEENEQRLRDLRKVKSPMQQLDEMAKNDRIERILKRLRRVRAYNVYQFYPQDVEKTKRKYKQQQMLTGILSQIYNYIAFGYKDPFVPVARSKMHLFTSVKAYYRKYTGPVEGPRYRKMYAERLKHITRLEAAKIKADEKRKMVIEAAEQARTDSKRVS